MEILPNRILHYGAWKGEIDMRSKAPLLLMEQLVMLLVFAFAAALCLQIFVLSGKLSEKYEIRDRAVLEAQNVAELLKKNDFNVLMEEMHFVQNDNNVYKAYFDENWECVTEKEEIAYYLQVSYMSLDCDYYWEAEITVYGADEVEMFKLFTAGQKMVEVA